MTDNQLPLEVLAIQCIADFPAPKTTQDSIDVMAAEFATANVLRSQAEKRYSVAKDNIVQSRASEVLQVTSDATENMMRMSRILSGADWALTISANTPSTKVDAYDLRTELVKRGVKVDLIDAAMKAVEKKSKPALVISATRMPD